MYILYTQPLEFERVFNMLAFVLLTVLLLLVVITSVWMLCRMRRKVNGLMKTIETISAELKEKTEIFDSPVVSTNNDKALQSLLSQIDSIYESYYRHGETETGKRNIVGQVQDILGYIREKEFLENLENAIDGETNNLLKDFYASVGVVQEKRRRLLVFSYYNLSVETICLILELTPNALYKRRGRLREAIEISGFPRSKELLKRIFPQK